ncbi:hypothetical protein AGMMS49949_09650 [Alphaproteobacteria bacterium]|nr:hypothetical protein AGMMS49949_09650 [Alphaproteobacteria bacterium]
MYTEEVRAAQGFKLDPRVLPRVVGNRLLVTPQNASTETATPNVDSDAVPSHPYSHYITLPYREDLLGEECLERGHMIFNYFFKPAGNFRPTITWKLYISAWPSNAARIAKRIIPLLCYYGIDWKIVEDLPRLRLHYNKARFNSNDTFSQMGKFLILYPRSDGEAKLAAELADEVLQMLGVRQKDPFFLSADMLVGTTGYLTTKFGDSYS